MPLPSPAPLQLIGPLRLRIKVDLLLIIFFILLDGGAQRRAINGFVDLAFLFQEADDDLLLLLGERLPLVLLLRDLRQLFLDLFVFEENLYAIDIV